VFRGVRVCGPDADVSSVGVRDESEGRGGPPCFRATVSGILRFRLAVMAGARSLEVWVKQPNPLLARPIMRVRRNTEIGLASDLSSTAPNGGGWVKVGPVSWVASVDGGVHVELETFALGHVAECWWDDLTLK
jgi:hypothetical protein